MKKELAAIVHIASIVAIVIGLMVIVFTLCFGHPTIGVTFATPSSPPLYENDSPVQGLAGSTGYVSSIITTTQPGVMCWSNSFAPATSSSCSVGTTFTGQTVQACESLSGTPNGYCEAGNPTPVR